MTRRPHLRLSGGLLAVALVLVTSASARGQTVEQSLIQTVELERAGQLRQAAELVDQLVDVAPEDYAVRLYAGWIALQEQRFDDAAIHYQAAVELSEGNPEALLGQARALSGAERFEEALELAERSVEGLPGITRAHLELAWILFNLEQYAASLASYRRVLELEPDNADARAGLGWCLVRLDRRRQARAEFDRVLEGMPEHQSAIKGRRAARRDLSLDAQARGLAFVGYKTPSTAWGGGVTTSLALRAGAFRPRLSYRYSQLQPQEMFTPGRPPVTPDASNSHFLAGGLDMTHRWLQVGVLGGYATTPELEWSAGVIAIHLGAAIWAHLDVIAALVLSGNDPLGQVSLSASFPVSDNLDLWAAFLLTIQGEGIHPLGEGGLRVHGRAWSVDVWGRYGTMSSRLIYQVPAFYDFVEDQGWGAGVAGSIPLSRRGDVGVNMQIGAEIMGTEMFTPSGNEASGLISLMHLGVQILWGSDIEERRQSCDDQ